VERRSGGRAVRGGESGIITLADKAYQGAEGPVVTPYMGKDKPFQSRPPVQGHCPPSKPPPRAGRVRMKRGSMIDSTSASPRGSRRFDSGSHT
jgi:hypothetical protein